MISTDRITEIFCSIDDFCKFFEPALKQRTLTRLGNKRNRSFKMATREVLTIRVLFHLSGHRTFRHFYLYYVQVHLQNEFPVTVSYKRFVELMQSNMPPLSLDMKTCCPGECTGISFVGPTPIRACSNKGIKNNKVFKDIATTGRSTMGGYGFKLPIVVNDKGELPDFIITQANVDDRTPIKEDNFPKKIFGRLYADKGYISKELVTLLFDQGLHLVTG